MPDTTLIRWVMLRRACVIGLALLLASCGGGGGGGANAPGSFTIASNTVHFAADINGATPPQQAVGGTISGVTGTVYLFVTTTSNGIANASVQVTGANTGQLTLTAKAPAALGLGKYSDTVSIRACLDTACSQPIGGSPQTITVTYDVTGLLPALSSITLASTEGLGSAHVTLNLVNGSGTNAYTTTVTYGPGATGWLNVPSSGSSASPSLDVYGGPLLAGAYTATLVVSAGSSSVSIPVTYTVVAAIGVSQSFASFSAVAGQTALPAATNLNVTSGLGSIGYVASVTYGVGANGWLSVTGSTAPGTLSIQPGTSHLPGGATYTASVTLAPPTGTPTTVSVSYAVTGAVLSVTPGSQAFAIDPASTAIDSVLKRSVTTGDNGAPLTWTAASSVPWLTVTASGASGAPATVTLVPAQLAPLPYGANTANVTFTYTGYGVASGSSVTVPVALDLGLPTVNYVADYVAYLNEQKPVIVRGSGFSRAGAGPLMFGGLGAQSTNAVSDTQIDAIPPAFAAGGAQKVSVGNALGVDRSRASLVVRSHPNYANAVLPAAVGIQGAHVVYDAQRDAVLSSRAFFGAIDGTAMGSMVNRYAYDAGTGTWTTTSKFFANLFDIALSPDGSELLVACTDTLYRVDPVTLATRSTITLTVPLGGTASAIAVTNDGTVITASNQAVSLLTGSIAAAPFAFTPTAVDGSLDGSRVVAGFADASNMTALNYYDAASGTVQTTSALQYDAHATLSRDASKLYSSGYVRNGSFALIGQISVSGANRELLSPDGGRLYLPDYTIPNPSDYTTASTGLRIFDVSGAGPTFPELTPIMPTNNPGFAVLGVSLDGKTVFLIGNNAFVVQPVP